MSAALSFAHQQLSSRQPLLVALSPEDQRPQLLVSAASTGSFPSSSVALQLLAASSVGHPQCITSSCCRKAEITDGQRETTGPTLQRKRTPCRAGGPRLSKDNKRAACAEAGGAHTHTASPADALLRTLPGTLGPPALAARSGRGLLPTWEGDICREGYEGDLT